MKYLFFLIFSSFICVVYGQDNSSVVYSQQDLSNFNDSQNVIVYHNSTIKGHEYLYGAWNRGMLVKQDSLFFAQNALRYDAYNDRILVKHGDVEDQAFEINDFNLTGFSIVEADTNVKHYFVNLEESDFVNHHPSGFYEVVFNLENNNYLLKKTVKYIYDPNLSKGVASQNNLQSEFKERISYYLKNNEGLYVKVKLKKKDILNVLNLHTSAMSTYIKAHSIHFNSDEEVAKLANYYYSLK